MVFISMNELQTSFNKNRDNKPRHAYSEQSAGDHSGHRCARMNTRGIQNGIKNHGKNRDDKESHCRNILPLQRTRQRKRDQSQKESKINSAAADTDAEFLSFHMEGSCIVLVADTREERVEHICALHPAGMPQERCGKNSHTPERYKNCKKTI